MVTARPAGDSGARRQAPYQQRNQTAVLNQLTRLDLNRRRLAHARQQRPAQRLLALHWSARRPCGGCPSRLLGTSALRMTASTGLEMGGLCSATARRESVEDQAIVLADGRTVGFADYGSPPATAVLWCHGGPGSRVEPAHLRSRAKAAALRIVGIDRPGYG